MHSVVEQAIDVLKIEADGILALQVLADRQRKGVHTDKQWEMMYGKTQRTQGQAAG